MARGKRKGSRSGEKRGRGESEKIRRAEKNVKSHRNGVRILLELHKNRFQPLSHKFFERSVSRDGGAVKNSPGAETRKSSK